MMLQGTTESRTMNTEPNIEDTTEPVLDDWCNPERAGEGDPLTRALPCPLTLTELGVLGDQIDVLIGQAEDLELEAKSSSSDFRARLASVAEKISRLSRQRRGRVIEREVEISVTYDLSRAEEIVTRMDTFEVVTRRTLTRAELADLRQTKIPSVSETGHPEPKKEPAGDPWADLPPPLYPLMSLVDGAILGEAGDLGTVEMADLRALAAYARDKGIPAKDERRQTIGAELAKRKRAARKAQDEVGDGSGTGD